MQLSTTSPIRNKVILANNHTTCNIFVITDYGYNVITGNSSLSRMKNTRNYNYKCYFLQPTVGHLTIILKQVIWGCMPKFNPCTHAIYVTGFDKTRLTRTKTEIHFIA